MKAIVVSLKKDLAKRPADQDLRNQLEEAQFNLDTHIIDASRADNQRRDS